MKHGINNAELDLKTSKQKNDKNDKIADVMESFLKDAKSRYETLDCMYNKMNESYKELADFYAFDPVKYTMSEFFTDLKTFSIQFQQCKQENAKMKETEEKIKRAEEERLIREKEKQARKSQKEKLMQPDRGEIGEKGVMDNLLEALQSGKLFEASSGSNGHLQLPKGRRPLRDGRRDLDFRRTILHKQSPRVVLQQVQ
jgi:hypothetical protein